VIIGPCNRALLGDTDPYPWDGSSIRVGPLQAATVPAGVVHRTIDVGRTVNLCFEKVQAETVFLDGPHA